MICINNSHWTCLFCVHRRRNMNYPLSLFRGDIRLTMIMSSMSERHTIRWVLLMKINNSIGYYDCMSKHKAMFIVNIIFAQYGKPNLSESTSFDILYTTGTQNQSLAYIDNRIICQETSCKWLLFTYLFPLIFSKEMPF